MTIERISRLRILRGLERVRDWFGRKRGDIRQGYADYCAVVPWGLRWAQQPKSRRLVAWTFPGEGQHWWPCTKKETNCGQNNGGQDISWNKKFFVRGKIRKRQRGRGKLMVYAPPSQNVALNHWPCLHLIVSFLYHVSYHRLITIILSFDIKLIPSLVIGLVSPVSSFIALHPQHSLQGPVGGSGMRCSFVNPATCQLHLAVLGMPDCNVPVIA